MMAKRSNNKKKLSYSENIINEGRDYFFRNLLMLERKKKLKGFGWQKAMKNPWKIDITAAIQHWQRIIQEVILVNS